MGDLEIQKNIELPGNRADDEFVPSLNRSKSIRMNLNYKSAIVHLLDAVAIEK
jgi:hypothetical protein